MYQVLNDVDLQSWVKSAFMLPEGKITAEEDRYRKLPNGLFKFSDTTLGGNQCINPLPQHTGFADINERRYYHDDSDIYDFSNVSRFMGRRYSETHDSFQIPLHIRFGVPTYNSMTRFFGNFYNSDAANLANKGRSNMIARSIGRIIGTVATFYIQPYILTAQLLRFLFDMPSTKYYYLKPAMQIYNDARSNIINTLSSNMGFVAGLSNTERPEGLKKASLPGESIDFKKLLPDVYNSNGSIDIFKVTTRYQRLANYRYKKLQESLDYSTSSQRAIEAVAEVYRQTGYPNDDVVNNSRDIDTYVEDYFSLGLYSPQDSKPTEDPNASEDFASELQTNIATQPAEDSADLYGKETPDPGFMTNLDAENRDGGQFVTFRIQDPGETTYSGSNNTKESGIASTINDMSTNAKNIRFNLADGNFVGGLAGDVIGAITSSVGALLSGVAESVGVSGLAALMGNALVDIPKHWDQSVSQLPRMTARMECRAWAGDSLTRLQSLIVPLASVMAGALPRSTGFQSYVGPFICEYFCKGRGQSRLAIIDGYTFKIGTGNVGFTKDRHPLGIDIEFSLIDLSSVLHMPLQAGFNPIDAILPGGISKYLLSDENTFTDMMAVVGSLDLVDQIYTTRRLRKNFHKQTLNFDQWFSSARWASIASNSHFLFGASPGRMLSGLAQPTDRGG